MTVSATQPTLTPETAAAQANRLRVTVSRCKTAIKRQREELHDAKARLEAFKARCRELGIQLTIQE